MNSGNGGVADGFGTSWRSSQRFLGFRTCPERNCVRLAAVTVAYCPRSDYRACTTIPHPMRTIRHPAFCGMSFCPYTYAPQLPAGVTPCATTLPHGCAPVLHSTPSARRRQAPVQPWCTGFQRVELAPKHQRARRRVNLTFHTGNGMLMSIFRLCAVKPPRNRHNYNDLLPTRRLHGHTEEVRPTP